MSAQNSGQYKYQADAHDPVELLKKDRWVVEMGWNFGKTDDDGVWWEQFERSGMRMIFMKKTVLGKTRVSHSIIGWCVQLKKTGTVLIGISRH